MIYLLLIPSSSDVEEDGMTKCYTAALQSKEKKMKTKYTTVVCDIVIYHLLTPSSSNVEEDGVSNFYIDVLQVIVQICNYIPY